MQAILATLNQLGYTVLLVWLVWTWRESNASQSKQAEGIGRKPNQRRAQSPRECPVCCAKHGAYEAQQQTRVVEPWRMQKSRRGRPKQLSTEGHSCPNTQCHYYQITDARIHALIGDGAHHGADDIQHWRCQACGTKFSARKHTPYSQKTSSTVELR